MPENRTVVRLTTSAWYDDRGVHVRRDLNYLKRKSCGLNILSEDCKEIGALDAVSDIQNLNECKDGVYEVVIACYSRDVETGYVDDYELKLVPYDEDQK